MVATLFLVGNVALAGSITLDPTTGGPDELVTVSGANFVDGQAIVLWNGVGVETNWTDEQTLTFVVPSNTTNGSNTVEVDLGDGQKTSSTIFTVNNGAGSPGGSCPAGYKCPNNRITCNTNECVLNNGGLPVGGDNNGGNNNNSSANSNSNSNSNSPLGAFPGEDLSFQDVLKIVNGFVCWILNIATTVMIIFIIWSGFMFMMAGANPTKQQEAIKNFKTVLWGILVIFAAGVIISTVGTLFGWRATAFIPLAC